MNGLRLFLEICILTLGHAAFNEADYARRHDVPLSGTTIFWTVDGDTLRLALKGDTSGFVAFGLAEPTVGGMAGADIMVGKVEGGVASVEDLFATAKETPVRDGCQDWKLVSGEESDGVTIIEVTRKLQTGDDQDRDIQVENAPSGYNRIIVAKGRSDAFGYHGATRWASMVNFGAYVEPSLDAIKVDCCAFECSVSQGMDMSCVVGNNEAATHSRFSLRNNHEIQPKVTDYNDAMLDLRLGIQQAGIPDAGIHIVGMEAVVNENTKKYIHHFTINADEAGAEILWAWVPGNGPYVLPAEAGIRLHKDNSTGPNQLMMQTHFDNPANESGLSDTSGIDIYVTANMREFDAGMLVLGDGRIRLYGQEVGDNVHTFECSSSCTQAFTGNLTVFGNMFHMHKWGQQMYTQQYRDGLLLDEWRADFYDYAFENYYSRERQIMPGDELKTTCVHKDVSTASVKWGLDSAEEMCMDFVAYYPKQPAAHEHCGHPDTCGQHSFTSPNARDPVAFGTECGSPATTTEAPTPETTTKTKKTKKTADTTFAPVYASLQKHAYAHMSGRASGSLSMGDTAKSAWEAITCKASSKGPNYITPAKPAESYMLTRALGCEYSNYDMRTKACTTAVSKMPPSGTGFSDDEITGMVDWILAGAAFDATTSVLNCAGGIDGGTEMTAGQALYDALLGEYGPTAENKLLLQAPNVVRFETLRNGVYTQVYAGQVLSMQETTVNGQAALSFTMELTVLMGSDVGVGLQLLGLMCTDCDGQALRMVILTVDCVANSDCLQRTVLPTDFVTNAFYTSYNFTTATNQPDSPNNQPDTDAGVTAVGSGSLPLAASLALQLLFSVVTGFCCY